MARTWAWVLLCRSEPARSTSVILPMVQLPVCLFLDCRGSGPRQQQGRPRCLRETVSGKRDSGRPT